MKIDKWITQKEYVDQTTGEIISCWKAQTEYITIRKIKNIKYESSINKQTKNRETIGIITYTVECGKQGRQLGIWDGQ